MFMRKTALPNDFRRGIVREIFSIGKGMIAVMLNGFKMIGLCLAKIQDEVTSKLLQLLYRETEETEYRLLVFNSFLDFFKKDKYGNGAASIYKLINFDLLDMLVIKDDCIYDKELTDRLIGEAKKRGIPVLILFGEREGCFSLVRNSRPVFSELVEHVLAVHGSREIGFLAGIKGEVNSEERLESCRAVMERRGLTLKEENIAYCDYWELPVERTIDRWAKEKRVPEAIICANDTMASTACDRLRGHGYRVPEDVIVTGFDGIESVSYHEPRLTTCCEDIPMLAKQCFEMIRGAVERDEKPFRAEERYTLLFSESCGCRRETVASYRTDAERLYSLVQSMRAHENVIYNWADHLVENTDIGEFGETIYRNILPGSSIALNNDFLVAARKNKITDPENPFTEKMIILSACDENYVKQNQEVFDLSEMVPGMAENLEKKGMYIFQSIYVMDKVFGYYVLKTSELQGVAHRLHRFFRVMNLAFGTFVSRLEQEHLTSDIKRMRYRDALTDLMNMRGLVREIENRRGEVRQKRMAVSVYCVAQYRFIYENYGLSDAEDAIRFVSEALQLANPINTILARISENEFAVLNIEDPAEDIGEIITRAVSVFFGVIESYNDDIEKDYFVEVNCGCTVVEPNCDGDILSFLKVASGEMYLNRLKSGNSPVLKERKTSEDMYRMFDLLIERDLFIYHFQPIVSARTGEIYAYEALMRTGGEIRMNPMEILDTAKAYRRLYDVEIATFRNVLSFVTEHRGDFEGKRVFINTIPGHFLHEDDYGELGDTYRDVLRMCTIEITEQNDISDEELLRIKALGGGDSACQLAVDDYGAGYSNIVNLLRYKPQVIKIDRFLITEIHKDNNKQMFVRNIIDFAQANGMLTIAEGVETSEELSAVIGYGVDLIQGFYTARPAPQPLQALSDEIREEILSVNRAFGRSVV